ncbi:Electron transport complex protein RnfC, partial [Haemophilus influenzae]
KPQKMK